MKHKKKVMVGGGGGYIGSVLVPYLIKKGYSVTVVDLFWFGNHLPKKAKIIKSDLFNISRKELAGFDSFIFLGGISNDPMANFNPKLNFLYNSSLPAYLAYEAKIAGVKRFIYGSSCSVYGNIKNISTETSFPTTHDPYGISKLQGEYGVLRNEDKTFSTIVFRQGTVCGWSPRMRFDLALNTMVKTALDTGGIVVDNPAVWRPICDIDELVITYEKAIRLKKDFSGIINVANGNYQILTLAQLVQKTALQVLNRKISITVNKTAIIRNYRVSLSKSEGLFGKTTGQSLEGLVRALLIKSSKIANINDDKYYNIRIFKKIKI